MANNDLTPPTEVRRSDSVVPESVNTPIHELYEMLKRISDGGGGIRELISNTIEQYGTMPIGATYTQYPGMKAPSEMWPGTWVNISNRWAGRFTRMEGGSAAGFGDAQGGGLPNITGGFDFYGGHTRSVWGALQYRTAYAVCDDHYTVQMNVGFDFNAAASNGLYGAANEVRPANITTRVWMRTA